ncbi:hydrolase, NUDIX family [Dictyocaulus viviparus]|uniref:Hydrolase, NUDIX family n=1 Tax=Dictyocaulus viviparus TaxID=29172 RepID=A0A0D8XRK5_DICVI|nr:hydrolase, NUDIX family [Dictyocaulus viviparus]
MIHKKCRIIDIPYLRCSVYRYEVPETKVRWSVPFPEYSPPDYTDPILNNRKWADPEISAGKFNWNAFDGKINRKSFMGEYALDSTSRPMNPVGRTGLRGRGVLGRWGPNHAADPLVTRYKNGKLQFVAIKRADTGEWAIPGGMVDAGEEVSQTLLREFSEETLGGKDRYEIKQLWNNGVELYKGYVDDPRNTDNAWMETVCVNFHDSTALLDNVELRAGDDAVNVRWTSVDDCEPLYASHEYFILLLKKLHGIN